MTKRLVLIDVSGYIYRAFHALPPLKNPQGLPVGALYGFCTMLLKILEEYRSDYVLAVFDSSRDSFRKTLYPDYKVHRSETPADLIPQFQLVREACDIFDVFRIEQDGYEADDLIASCVEQFHTLVDEVVILSSDKDLMQLICANTYMFDPIKQKKIDQVVVMEKFGVAPEKVIDVQSLIGDASDNIPGAPGIGPKTAAELIGQFGSLDNLLAHVDDIKQPSRKKSLSENKDQILLSRELVTLKRDLSLNLELGKLHLLEKSSPDRMLSFFETHGFKRLSLRFAPKKQVLVKSTYHLIQDIDMLDQFIEACLKADVVAVDTETTSLDTRVARLVGISLSHAEFTGVYIPISHQGLGVKQLELDVVKARLKPLFEDQKIKKVGHNIKYDRAVLARHGMHIENMDDTMVMSYVLDSAKNGHGLDELASLHLDHINIPYKQVTTVGKTQVTFDYVSLEVARDYAAEDADITLRLYQLFKIRLQHEDLAGIYKNLDLPLVDVLLKMEQEGVKVDSLYLTQLSGEFSKLLMGLEQKIYQEAGSVFNIASPKQLGDILFKRLQFTPPKKSKTGQYVTNVDVLEDLVAQGIPMAQLLLDWRQLAKLKSTYTDALVLKVNAQSGRIHTSFSQTIASTGRLSSSDPNLQNIPVRSEEGRKIRRAFVAPPHHRLVSFDYSQIELRILAHMADIVTLKSYFHQQRDIHVQTASRMFKIPESMVTSDLRRQAKAINFGIIYGMSAFGLSQSLKISQEEAKTYIATYFAEFPEIKTYMDQTKVYAAEHGYVLTLSSRKCAIPGIGDKNGNIRSFAERQAINAPIQGTSADIIKAAMIAVDQFLQAGHYKTKMVLQVHDELLFEVCEDELTVILPKIQALMEETGLSIPTPVNYNVGDNWAQIHD